MTKYEVLACLKLNLKDLQYNQGIPYIYFAYFAKKLTHKVFLLL